MFCKASLVTVALALMASATPVEKDSGISIDLPKRASLTKADGTFDHEAAIMHNIKTHKFVGYIIALLFGRMLINGVFRLQQVPEELAQP